MTIILLNRVGSGKKYTQLAEKKIGVGGGGGGETGEGGAVSQ